MTFTLSFSHIVNHQRVPLYKDGKEVTLQVEADSKTATYAHPEVIKLCQDNQATVRRVN